MSIHDNFRFRGVRRKHHIKLSFTKRGINIIYHAGVRPEKAVGIRGVLVIVVMVFKLEETSILSYSSVVSSH